MTIAIAGALLAALGLLAAAMLVAAPLGLVAAAPGLSLWILFPLLTLLGYVALVMGDREPLAMRPTRFVAIPLLAMALLAAAGLVATGAGLAIGSTTPASGEWSSLAQWYVLVVAGVPGALGVAALSKRGVPDTVG